MKILITGGSGFIGSNLKKRLYRNNYDVLSPSREELDLVNECSVTTFFKKHNFDIVIHCATWDAKWNSKKGPSMILDHNIRMFFNLIREKDHFGRLLCLGSGAEFGKLHYIPLSKENYFDAHVPLDPYGFSKYIINKYIKYIPDTVNLRLFGVFGQHEDWQTRFISNAICRAIYNLPLTIIQDVLFDYLYIEDLLDIIEWFLNYEPKEKVYNICTGKTYSLSDIAKMILEILNKDIPIEVLLKGYGIEYSGDNSRLCSEMHNLQFTPMRKAIGILVQWYQQNINQIPYEVIKENKLVLMAQLEVRNQ